MMIAFEQRACTVLFNLLKSHQTEGPFLLPSNICPIVPLVFFKVGRQFEFIDIAPDTLCMDLQQLGDRWAASDRATPAGLIYVRTYGAIFDTEDIFTRIKTMSPCALIVDDRCLCEPSFDAELVLHADAALYSTGYAKFVDVGFGGVGVLREGVPYRRTELAFNPEDLAKITVSYKRSLATKTTFHYVDTCWLDTAVPDCLWPDFRKRVEQELVLISEIKQNINSVYSSRLPVSIQFTPEFQNWRFNIHVHDKSSLLDVIRSEGLFASDHYESLDGIFGAGVGHQSRNVHQHVINLFNDRYFSVSRAENLVDVLLSLDSLRPSEIFK